LTELDPKRVSEMFWLFGHVLPIYESHHLKNCETAFGVKFTKMIPDLALSIGSMARNNLEFFDLYLDFILEAVKYMRCETNDQPTIDQNQEELSKVMKQSIEKFNQDAKPISL